VTAFPSLSELNSIAETMGLRTTKRACPSEQLRSDIYSALIVIDQAERIGRPLRGNHALVFDGTRLRGCRPTGFDQAQGCER
jgi:hypothetical protein